MDQGERSERDAEVQAMVEALERIARATGSTWTLDVDDEGQLYLRAVRLDGE